MNRNTWSTRISCAIPCIVAALVVGLPASADGGRASIAARAPMPKPPLAAQPAYATQLIVKFVDGARARAGTNGRVAFTGSITVASAPVSAILSDSGVSFTQLIDLPSATIDALEARAAANSSTASADLAGMMVVHAPAAQLPSIAASLWAAPEVEFVHWQELQPPPPGCTDAAPATSSYVSNQLYRGPNPGINMVAAWPTPGARGGTVVVADCEYAYDVNHEDLCGVVPEPGQTPHPNVYSFGWDDHGTATLGEMFAGDNAYGCTGLVPDIEARFFPEWTVQGGARRVAAITNAIASVDAGDVVLLEMQTTGAGGGYAPAEVDPAVWTVVKTGSSAGVIVVGAAGNGNQNLDSAPYAGYMAWGDSGAIIVGAGTANTSHNKLGFSTYGARVNVQGWGESVFTLGYGGFAQVGGDPSQSYTSTFSGTSSASPIVASAVASIQGVARIYNGANLTPAQMRALLISTGVPQGTGGHIGPLPNVAAAVATIAVTPIGDLNKDGLVDGADLGILLAQWGTSGHADLNGNGMVDGADLGILLGSWTS